MLVKLEAGMWGLDFGLGRCQKNAMGFYLELKACEDNRGYREAHVPAVYWFLFLFTGCALLGMGLSAHSVLGRLAAEGGAFDRALLAALGLALPFYLLVGLKLAFVRKEILFGDDSVESGYRVGSLWLFRRVIRREAIAEVQVVNHRPGTNLAVREHSDSQYHLRGHWRLVLKLKSGRVHTLDRHTEEAALEPLRRRVVRFVAGEN